jgi:hypothetical protein
MDLCSRNSVHGTYAVARRIPRACNPEGGRFVNCPYRIPNNRNPFPLLSFEIAIEIGIVLRFQSGTPEPSPLARPPGTGGTGGTGGSYRSYGSYRTKTEDNSASSAAGHSSPVTRHFHNSVHWPCAVSGRIQDRTR